MNRELNLFYIVRSSHIWLNTRLYLINMALSDIIMCLTALPITPFYTFSGYWMFGETLCKLLPTFQVTKIQYYVRS